MPTAYVACSLCSGPLRSDSKYGVCSRNQDCQKALWALRASARAEQRRIEWNAWYQANKTHRNEYQSLDRAAHPEKYREREKRRTYNPGVRARARAKYLSRTDRACRYARAGCQEFAIPGGQACPVHHLEDNRRHRLAWEARKREFLGERQSWVCPWCEGPITAESKTDIDHIIPKACGIVIEEDWNLQLLHASCNRSKRERITAQAVALAAEHGIELTPDGYQQVGGP